ncbi:hypothetical protein [Parabacteroides distasonis]|uniref:hypothetical protein n=1 Tax=Parabacteroides distasonis TaxID=823 RepID=UPI001898694F|nr:hypothetical protein [Parabacteroides distasonis]
MTKLSNIPTKGVAAKAARTRKAKTEPTKPKWDPTQPIHFTQEEIWEHIHEIEKGPFMTLDECFKDIHKWMDEKATSLQ